jgi:GH35 family endo-1,4-beta-xylanase
MKLNLQHLTLVCVVVLTIFPPRTFADWRSDANASIEQIRKRDWVLQVRNTNGQPVVGATVQVRQRRHDFAFGCALNSEALIGEPRYADFFARNFEWAVFENETKWPSDEPVQGQLDYRRPDMMVAFCRKHALTLRGHTIFWEATNGGYEHPAWLDLLDTNQLRSAVIARLNSVVARFRGTFQHWDINNEMLHGNYFRGRLGTSIVPFMFQQAGALEPRVKRFVNDYNVIEGSETDSYRMQVTNLLATGAQFEGIGVQGHFGGRIIDPVVLKSRFDTLSAPGLPIWVSEYDSVQSNATNRADNLETLYRVAFSHTNVQGVLMWGFWAGAHWLGADAAIVDANWAVNAAGQRYTNLLQEWTTVTNGVTDANGRFSLRGFRGDYDVTLSAPGQTTVTQSVVLANGPGAQTNILAFVPIPELWLTGDLILGDVMALKWGRAGNAISCLIESSTNLSNWEVVSPRLDPLATAWTCKLTNTEARRFFRVRLDPMPPPDFDYYEATGAKRTATINGSGVLTTADTGLIHRNFYVFGAPDLRNGVFSFTEDVTEPSPNGGPPGVLRFSMDTKPTTVGQSYWGFILRPGSVAEWPASGLSTTHLGKTRLRFRYKLTSGGTINVRLEPSSAGYNERCDFGNITGNGQWQEFNQLLSGGANVTAFLNFLNTGGERYLNLVYGNGSALSTYTSGDTLLLDDISVYYEP